MSKREVGDKVVSVLKVAAEVITVLVVIIPLFKKRDK